MEHMKRMFGIINQTRKQRGVGRRRPRHAQCFLLKLLRIHRDPTALVPTVTMERAPAIAQQKGGMKPHYLCNRSECQLELALHQYKVPKDLTVEELRVLLREARRAAGLIPPEKKNTLMDQIRKANKPELVTMCNDRQIPCNKATVGEMRIALRRWLVESGTGETIMEIGKHAGATFMEIAKNHKGYMEWAVKEINRSEDPDWRLVQLARWAIKTQAVDSMEDDAHANDKSAATGSAVQLYLAAAAPVIEKTSQQVDQMAHVMQGMMNKMQALEEKVEAQEQAAVHKTRKTSTASNLSEKSFAMVEHDPTSN